MNEPQIDIEKFGWNGNKTSISYINGILIFKQNTLIAAVLFLIIALIPGAAFVNQGAELSGLGILWIVIAASFAVLAILYALYVQQVEFHFTPGTFVLKKGFRCSVKNYQGPFKDIEGVVVRKTEMKTRSSSRRLVSTRWEIELLCLPKSPTFSLYMTDKAESAKYISDTLSQSIGCPVCPKNNPFDEEI